MLAALRLEQFGDNHRAWIELQMLIVNAAGVNRETFLGKSPPRPWVARLTGRDDKFGFAREFLRGRKDYSESNAPGSRGVYRYYELPPGFYEIQEQTAWTNFRRYFARSEEGRLVVVSREEVLAALTVSGG